MERQIDWSNPASQVTEHFTVKELTLLPSWKIYHQPSEVEKVNLIKLAEKMEEVREFLGKGINVHVTIRPTSVNCPGSPYHGRNYNQLVGGAPLSAHTLGLAMDFNPFEMVCDEGRFLLEPKLEELGLRMEKRPGSNWIHLDLMPPHPNRYFKP